MRFKVLLVGSSKAGELFHGQGSAIDDASSRAVVTTTRLQLHLFSPVCETFGEFDVWLVSANLLQRRAPYMAHGAVEGRMQYELHLFGDGGHHARMIMADVQYADAADEVEITFTLCVSDVGAFGSFHENRMSDQDPARELF